MKYIISLLLILNFIQAKGSYQAENSAICSEKNYLAVSITANTKTDNGQVTVLFQRAFTDVSVNITGLDGLKNINVIQNSQHLNVAANSEQTFDVLYTAPEGKSYISVVVTAIVNGHPTSTIKAFSVGQQSSVQKTASQKNVTIDSEGNKIMLMPATVQ